MSAAGMQPLGDFHHYRADAINSEDRVALCERRIIEILLTSSLPDEARDSSIAFELKHHHSVAQLGRILSRKRDLPLEVCTAGALLHDIHVIQHGSYADHAHLGAPLALEILRDIGGFSATELEQVHTIVFNHSDKHIWSADPLAEFGKDADVLDCFLYPGAFDYYLRHKSLAGFAAYLKRAKTVWSELAIPPDSRFTLLDGFEPGWLGRRQTLDRAQAMTTLVALELLAAAGPASPLCPPPFAVRVTGMGATFWTNSASWGTFLTRVGENPDAASVTLGVHSSPGLQGLLALDPALPSGDIAPLASSLKSGALKRAPELELGPIVVWPALARYEPISATPLMSPRGEELGL
jgi:HD domain